MRARNYEMTSASSAPAIRPPRVPAHARTYYKVVAISGGGRFVSIYDGTTTYALDSITAPRGGCWVCPDLLAVVQHSTTLPSRSALLEAPRAILQCAGWNAAGQAPRVPRSHAAMHSTTKLLVTHVMPLAVLPYTAAAQPGVPAAEHAFLSDGVATLSSTVRTGRPQSAPAPRPPAMQMPPGAALRTFGGGNAQAQRLQATTAGLHEDVMLAQARLNRLRAVNTVSVVPADGRPPSAWIQRALARTGSASASETRTTDSTGPSPRARGVRAA